MSRYISAHVITCMTRQELQKLIKRFLQEATADIRILRVQSDTVAGRMVCEWEAPSQEALVEWLGKRNIRFRGQEEWAFKVQMEARNGELVTL